MTTSKARWLIAFGFLAWAGIAHAQQLPCGQLVSGTLSAPNVRSLYFFSAAVGERLSLYLREANGGPAVPRAGVWYIDSSGRRSGTGAACGAGPGWRYARCEFKLTAPYVSPTGVYQVEVYHSTQAVSFQIELQRLTPGVACADELPCGTSSHVELDLPGRIKVLRFEGEAQEKVNIGTFRASGDASFAPFYRLHDPTGKWVSLGPQGALPVAGPYLVAVEDVGGLATGTARVVLQRLTPSLACAPMVCPGEVASGHVTDLHERAVFRFNGTAGDRMSARAFPTGGHPSFGANLWLRRPNGLSLGGSSGVATWDLVDTGPHLIEIWSSTYVPGEFNLTLESLNGTSSCLMERLSIYDPVFPRSSSQVDATGGLSPYLDDYDVEGSPRVGAVADGVTKLVLKYRADSANPVRFTLPSGYGALMEIGVLEPSGNIEVIPVAGSDGSFDAYAIYQAPAMADADLPGGLFFRWVPVVIRHDLGLTETRYLELHRPPVVLVHGLWDDRTGWDWFDPELQGLGWVTERASYPSAVSFDPRLPMPLNRPVTSVFRTIVRDVLPKVREDEIAATQVYVVAHSMGGLVTRALSQQPQYRRGDNYGEGDIHGLLTIGTPHFGSAVADLVFSNPCLLVGPNGFRPVIGIGNTLSGAVRDLRTTSGAVAALNAAPEFATPTHTLVGIASPLDELAWKKVWTQIFHWLDGVEECGLELKTYEPLADPVLLHGGRSDLIVSETSQNAGRTDRLAVSTVEFTVHNEALSYLSLFPQERESQDVLDRTVDVLGRGSEFSHAR